jgi:hypothetical protein
VKRILKITTVNVFKDDASWQQYKAAMQANLSIVDFGKLEGTGEYLIDSGDEQDGAHSVYQLEVEE